MAEVRRKYPNVVVAIVGRGREETVLREMSAKLGVNDIVRFVGHRSDMTDIYNSTDLVVQSSSTEGMPNVVLESLLMETPVVATAVGGTSEVIEHGKTGFLIAPGSELEIFRGLTDFLENMDLHKGFGKRGRKHVVENFNHEDRVQRTAALYTSISRKENL